MITRISESEDILTQLKKDGKAVNIDVKAYNEAVAKINLEMEAVRRDFKQKDSESQKSAARVVLTS